LGFLGFLGFLKKPKKPRFFKTQFYSPDRTTTKVNENQWKSKKFDPRCHPNPKADDH